MQKHHHCSTNSSLLLTTEEEAAKEPCSCLLELPSKWAKLAPEEMQTDRGREGGPAHEGRNQAVSEEDLQDSGAQGQDPNAAGDNRQAALLGMSTPKQALLHPE